MFAPRCPSNAPRDKRLPPISRPDSCRTNLSNHLAGMIGNMRLPLIILNLFVLLKNIMFDGIRLIIIVRPAHIQPRLMHRIYDSTGISFLQAGK